MFCVDCCDCNDCWNCADCNKLVNCDNCADCNSSEYLVKCDDSTKLYKCNRCTKCYRLNNCDDCYKCRHLDESNNCIKCNNCTRCYHSYKLNGFKDTFFTYGNIEDLKYEIKFEFKNLNSFLANISKLYKDYYVENNENNETINDDDIIDKLEDFKNFNKIENTIDLQRLTNTIIQLHMVGIRNKYMDDMIYNINYLKINECTEVLGAFGVIGLNNDVDEDE